MASAAAGGQQPACAEDRCSGNLRASRHPGRRPCFECCVRWQRPPRKRDHGEMLRRGIVCRDPQELIPGQIEAAGIHLALDQLGHDLAAGPGTFFPLLGLLKRFNGRIDLPPSQARVRGDDRPASSF
jgi:hypothetical protein